MKLALPRIAKSDVLDYDGERLRLEREWEDGTLLMTRLSSDRPFLIDGEVPTAKWFLQELGDRLTIVPDRVAAVHDWANLEQDERSSRYREARRVQFVLTALDERGCLLSLPAIKRHLADIFTAEAVEQYGDPPPASTVKKWMKTRGSIGHRSLENCMPKRGAGPRVKRLHSEVLKLRTDAAIWFWTAREHTVEDAHAEHVRAVAEYNVDRKLRGLAPVRCCSIEWLRVEIKKLQSFQTYSAKFGLAKAHAVYKADGLGVRASRFLEVGMIDHHTFDAWVGLEEIGDEYLPAGRPTVTVMFDVFTECVLSAVVHFTPPSLFNMLDAVKQANRPKMTPTRVGGDEHFELLASIYGRCDTIIPDNAWEFTGTSGQDSLQDLGCHLDWARAGKPKDKAKLERWFGTLISQLSSKLPGMVFDQKTMKDLGYNPSTDKVISASQLRELLAEQVAFYHLNHHEGLHAQPARIWQKQVQKYGTIPVIKNDRQIDQIMGMVEEKTLTTAGIKMFGRYWYGHSEHLEAIIARNACDDADTRKRRGRKRSVRLRVKVKYNPADVSQIHVYDPRLSDYVTLECKEEFLRGLSRKHLDTLERWTSIQNIAFNTPEERKNARAILNEVIRRAAPHVAKKHRAKFAALVEGGAGADDSGTVTFAHTPSVYGGMGQVTGHETAVATRTDGGAKPSGPRPPVAKRGKSKQGPRVTPVITSGSQADSAVRRSLPLAADDDWSGL